MRIKLKPKNMLKQYEERVQKKFALFPKTLKDGYFVWLEHYYSLQICYHPDPRRYFWAEKDNWSHSSEKKKLLTQIKYSEELEETHE